ncbi:MAG: LysM peptidoglycan-binding domain-containing protein [Candidatus Pacebacteria bacterium]|nr:LysM peptidoglycan-binding domain-containing protein [Candidatus Paceibacterota bacterium]
MKFEGKKDISIIKYNFRNYKKLAKVIQKNKLKPFKGLFSFFRSYITVFAVIFLLSFALIISSSLDNNSQKGSIVFNYLDENGGREKNEIIVVKSVEESGDAQVVHSNIPMVKVASTSSDILMDLNQELKEKDIRNLGNTSDLIDMDLLGGNSFLAPAVYYDESLKDTKYGIVFYEVVSGDTASSIATAFGISTYTVLWANNLQTRDIIKIGRKLEVLPITGVKHIVEEGDTVDSITTMYKADADEIIIYNDLPAHGLFRDGSVGKVIVIPNGEKKSPVTMVAPIPRTTNGQVVSSSKYQTSKFYNPFGSHTFFYGHCTYYVAGRVRVPWSGDAKYWLGNARAHGYETGNIAAVGSIVATNESQWGHVAYVEAVNGDTITISEMNYVAWNRQSIRVLPITSSVIKGYIYMN